MAAVQPGALGVRRVVAALERTLRRPGQTGFRHRVEPPSAALPALSQSGDKAPHSKLVLPLSRPLSPAHPIRLERLPLSCRSASTERLQPTTGEVGNCWAIFLQRPHPQPTLQHGIARAG